MCTVKSNNKRVLLVLPLIVLIVLCLSSCGKKKEVTTTSLAQTDASTTTGTSTTTQTTTQTTTTTTTTTTTADVSHEGEVRSALTGEWISEELANKRPMAFMFNNIKFANPQSGVGSSDILYEILAEGGITRLMGIITTFEKESEGRIGSARSARHYFASIADEYDAIFIHFGETTYATKKFTAIGLNHLSGMYGAGGSAFYRDKNIKAPHNAFATLSGLEDSIAKSGFRTTIKENYTPHFDFYEEETKLSDVYKESAKAAKYTKMGFSDSHFPYFEYDETTKTYKRFQMGGPHIDYNTKKQLEFTNVIIELVKERNKDKNGYQTIDFEEATGEGYLLSGGECINITWKKSESAKTMQFFDEKGELLKLNTGKTFIAVYPTSRTKYLTISESIPE